MYKIGHTIPKTYPGGFRLDFIRSWYQRSDAVLDEESPPRISAINTYRKTRYLFLSKLLNS